MTAANVVTILRIILVPILVVLLLTEMQNRELIAFIVFIIAAVSDALDGYLARKLDEVTDLGKFLDPLADKLLVAGTLIALVSLGKAETWVATIIILREIFMTGFRVYFLVNDASFSSLWSAKFKTFFQVSAIAALIIGRKLPTADIFFQAGTVILYLAAALSIYSAIEYIVKYSKFSKDK